MIFQYICVCNCIDCTRVLKYCRAPSIQINYLDHRVHQNRNTTISQTTLATGVFIGRVLKIDNNWRKNPPKNLKKSQTIWRIKQCEHSKIVYGPIALYTFFPNFRPAKHDKIRWWFYVQPDDSRPNSRSIIPLGNS